MPPGVSLRTATGACTVIGPRSGSCTTTNARRARKCSSAQELGGVADRSGGRVLCLEDLHRFIQRVLAHPGGHEFVHLTGPRLAGNGIDVLGTRGQFGPPDGSVDALGDARRRAGEGQLLAVEGPVRVAGRAGVDPVADAAGDDAVAANPLMASASVP
jgi:hypothetical protein